MIIKTFNTFKELESVRNHWERWQYAPNSDYMHYKLVCRLRRKVASPYVIMVEEHGKGPRAIVCCRLERIHVTPAVGYLKFPGGRAKALVVLHNGILGRMNEDAGKAVVCHLRNLLTSGVIDLVMFYHLQAQSPLMQAVLSEYNGFLTERNPAWSTHWAMELPEKPGFLLNRLKSKHRSWIRNRERKLESAFPGKVVWRWVNQFEDLRILMARIETVAAKTYQRGLGAGFRDDEEHRQRYALFARRGQLRIKLLEIEGCIKAFWVGILYNNVFYSSETGYDPDLKSYEPGTLLFLRLVDELVLEGVQKLDFGLGDAYYKQRFGDHSWLESTIRIFAPSGKGLAFRTVLSVSNFLDTTGRALLHRTGLLDRVKTGWRRRKAAEKPKDGKK